MEAFAYSIFSNCTPAACTFIITRTCYEAESNRYTITDAIYNPDPFSNYSKTHIRTIEEFDN